MHLPVLIPVILLALRENRYKVSFPDQNQGPLLTPAPQRSSISEVSEDRLVAEHRPSPQDRVSHLELQLSRLRQDTAHPERLVPVFEQPSDRMVCVFYRHLDRLLKTSFKLAFLDNVDPLSLVSLPCHHLRPNILLLRFTFNQTPELKPVEPFKQRNLLKELHPLLKLLFIYFFQHFLVVLAR